MNVPRETSSAWMPAVHGLYLRKWHETALEMRAKTEHRTVVTDENSIVAPGHFSGLDLESGRVRPASTGGRLSESSEELRVRCQFPSGPRAVTVSSFVSPGDVLFVKRPQVYRSASQWTLQVLEVTCSRLQDMTPEDACREGAEFLPDRIKRFGANLDARSWYADAWGESGKGPQWYQNPWVWIYTFKALRVNVDNWLKQVVA